METLANEIGAEGESLDVVSVADEVLQGLKTSTKGPTALFLSARLGSRCHVRPFELPLSTEGRAVVR